MDLPGCDAGDAGEKPVEVESTLVGRTTKLEHEDETGPESAAGARAAGSYLHNAFHNDKFRAAWLNALRRRRGLPEREPVSTTAAKEAAYDALAAHARKNLDIDYIVKISGVK